MTRLLEPFGALHCSQAVVGGHASATRQTAHHPLQSILPAMDQQGAMGFRYTAFMQLER